MFLLLVRIKLLSFTYVNNLKYYNFILIFISIFYYAIDSHQTSFPPSHLNSRIQSTKLLVPYDEEVKIDAYTRIQLFDVQLTKNLLPIREFDVNKFDFRNRFLTMSLRKNFMNHHFSLLEYGTWSEAIEMIIPTLYVFKFFKKVLKN